MRGTKSAMGGSDAARASATEPISERVPKAIAMTGFSGSRIYELIKSGERQIGRDGNCTFILVASLKEVILRRIVRRGGLSPLLSPAI